MMIADRATEQLVALQGAFLRILASVATFGVRIATRIGQRDTDIDPPRQNG